MISFTEEPIPWACVQDKIQAGASMISQPASEEAYDKMRSWYDTCRDRHDICNERSFGKGPSRLLLIDRNSTDIANTVRLVECDEGIPPSYVALSHCWGESNHLQTTSDSLDKHTAGIEVTSLSRTFRDAIAICQQLGESYLWIDSLCIIQDDHEGKAAEIERMQSIYEGASLTISAMSAKDGRGGCWIPRERLFQIPVDDVQSAELVFRRVHEIPPEHAPFLTEFPHDVLYTQYPLATRKWALQERLLSQRLIHLTSSELVWECQMDISCECRELHNPIPGYSTYQRVRGALRRSSENRDELIREWMKLVESYSRGELTRERDAFPAIAGLARKFSQKGLIEYFAGFWVEGLPLTLCWSSRPLVEGVTDNQRPSTYVAPSWSWASIQGPLCFDAWDDFGPDSDARTQIEESECEGQCAQRWRDDSSFQFSSSQCEDDDGSDSDDGYGLEIVAGSISMNLGCDPLDGAEFGRIVHGFLSMRTVTYVVGPHSVSENSILGFEGSEFLPDTFDDIPFAKECVVALIFVRNSSDDDEVMSDGDDYPSRNTWEGQALVLVELEEEQENDDNINIKNNGDEKMYRRCGLLYVSKKSLAMFGEEEVVLTIL